MKGTLSEAQEPDCLPKDSPGHLHLFWNPFLSNMALQSPWVSSNDTWKRMGAVQILICPFWFVWFNVMLSGESSLHTPQRCPQLSTQILGTGYLVDKDVMTAVINDFWDASWLMRPSDRRGRHETGRFGNCKWQGTNSLVPPEGLSLSTTSLKSMEAHFSQCFHKNFLW